MKNDNPLSLRRWGPTLVPLLVLFSLQACGGGGSSAEPAASGSVGAVVPEPVPGPELPIAGLPVPSPVPVPAPAPAAVPAPPVIAVPPANPDASPGNLVALTSATSCGIPGFREALLARVNAERAAGRSCGGQRFPAVAPMAWNDRLFSAAARHSVDMASRNYFAHTSPEGMDAAARVAKEGYGWSALGENIAAGDVSVHGVMATWLDSDGHCRNVMNPVFADVAVACVARPGTTWGTYWTMVLAR